MKQLRSLSGHIPIIRIPLIEEHHWLFVVVGWEVGGQGEGRMLERGGEGGSSVGVVGAFVEVFEGRGLS